MGHLGLYHSNPVFSMEVMLLNYTVDINGMCKGLVLINSEVRELASETYVYNSLRFKINKCSVYMYTIRNGFLYLL